MLVSITKVIEFLFLGMPLFAENGQGLLPNGLHLVSGGLGLFSPFDHRRCVAVHEADLDPVGYAELPLKLLGMSSP